MWRAIKRQLRSAIAPAIFLALVGYFGWSATQGDRGLSSYAQRQTLLATANAELAKAVAERDAWERRVAGLRNSHLDRDTLDERARAMLNLSDPNDVVVPYAPKDKLF
jgi:cell division protein FtsB